MSVCKRVCKIYCDFTSYLVGTEKPFTKLKLSQTNFITTRRFYLRHRRRGRHSRQRFHRHYLYRIFTWKDDENDTRTHRYSANACANDLATKCELAEKCVCLKTLASTTITIDPFERWQKARLFIWIVCWKTTIESMRSVRRRRFIVHRSSININYLDFVFIFRIVQWATSFNQTRATAKPEMKIVIRLFCRCSSRSMRALICMNADVVEKCVRTKANGHHCRHHHWTGTKQCLFEAERVARMTKKKRMQTFASVVLVRNFFFTRRLSLIAKCVMPKTSLDDKF